jgi:DNA processing protein
MLAAGGVVLSEYPPGDPPLARNFPARNRIISGLARTTVVVQAPARSGALITADYALEQGRELVVHRAGIAGERGTGSRRLAEQGAAIIDRASDILGDWGWEQCGLENKRQAVRVCDRQNPGKQLARTLEAELAGRIVCRSGNIFTRNTDGK